jgi:serpin B
VVLLCTLPFLGSTPGGPVPVVIPELSQRINAFSLDLLKHHARSAQAAPNAVLSPQGIFQALALSYLASGGETRNELAGTMHFPEDNDRLAGDIGRLRGQIESAAKDKRIEVTVANSAWLDGSYAEFRKSYTDHLEKALGVSFRKASFRRPGEASGEINRWVSRETRGRIKQVIGAEDLRSRSGPGVVDEPGLVTVNAVYFKADWGSRFEAGATRDLPFHLDRSRTQAVPTMHQRSVLLHAADDQFQFLEIPYVDGRFSMYIFLPGEILPVQKLVEPLSVERITKLKTGAAPCEVDVLLPKFEFRTHVDVKGALCEMGVKAAFDSGKADFDRMIVKKLDAYRVYLSDVFHDASIEVHEKGTVATAVTTSVHYSIGCSAAPSLHPPRVDFHADRPFVFAIVHNESRSVLFAGWISDPKAPAGSAAANTGADSR